MHCSSLPTLQIIEVSVAGQLVVCFKGKACKKAAPAWQKRFLQLAAERHPLLVLDLSELESVSNHFLTSLQRLADGQHRHGGHIQLLWPLPVVKQMLSVYELRHLVQWDESTVGQDRLSSSTKTRMACPQLRPARS